MNSAMTKEGLEQILDQALQDVTERTAGVRLYQGNQPLGEDLCTVHITFDKGFDTSLTLCADTALLIRMAQNSFHEEAVSHFGAPVFYHGRYEPEDQDVQFILTYSDEHSEGAQLIHHVPRVHEDGAAPNHS